MENVGGDLVDQCRKRDIKQVFTCPHHPEMDFAEGYIGRITTMASFAMVFSGAPLFMWVWSVRTAVFVNNLMAAYFSMQKVWAAPYELVHGESFPDASIIVPFGCGVLVLLKKGERAKFKSRCALMVFVHYADDHPLYTYAVYSPLTKRVLMRQDCIFLPTLFPMRAARSAAGMTPDGEPLLSFRSPPGIREGSDPDYSFDGWSESDPLPEYEDQAHGYRLTRPLDSELIGGEENLRSPDTFHYPSHPSFGNASVVAVRAPSRMGVSDSLSTLGHETSMMDSHPDPGSFTDSDLSGDSGTGEGIGPPTSEDSLLPFPREQGVDEAPDNLTTPPRPQIPITAPISGGDRTTFVINLEFPGQDLQRRRYRVSPSMKVRLLYHLIATEIVECGDNDIRIYVDGACLMHLGTITDRHFPGVPLQATVYLYRDCTAYVRRVGGYRDGISASLDGTSPSPKTDMTRGGASPVGDKSSLSTDEFVEPILQRRASTRVSARTRASNTVAVNPRRSVRDRWYYDPVVDPPALVGSSDINDDISDNRPVLFAKGILDDDDDSLSPSPKKPRNEDTSLDVLIPVSRRERAILLREFRRNQRLARVQYKHSIRALWDAEVHDDKENTLLTTGEELDPEVEAEAYEDYCFAKMMRYDEDLACQLAGFRTTLRITPEYLGGPNPELIRDRTMALWEGLRRVYFGIQEAETIREPAQYVQPRASDPSAIEDILFPREVTGFLRDFAPADTIPLDPDDPIVAREIEELRREIAELEARARRHRTHPDSGVPFLHFRRGDDDDEPDNAPGPSISANPLPRASGESPICRATETTPNNTFTSDPSHSATSNECDRSSDVYFFSNGFDQSAACDFSNGEDDELDTDPHQGVNQWGVNLYNETPRVDQWGVNLYNETPQSLLGNHSPHELVCGPREDDGYEFFQDKNREWTNGEWTRSSRTNQGPCYTSEASYRRPRKAFLSVKTLRRILSAKESIFKYGVFVPRNDKDADSSPEHARWASGRTLEWMRLQDQGTFGRNWDWSRVQKKFPNYLKRDVGHVFFVYDFKYSGEHRVRLVFDGSRQNPETYTDTYAPTARGESVRLFHIFAVEESWEIAQYDVPQAFLKSIIDCDIFVYPPRNFIEFPGQLLKLNLSLYGAKQSAALWNKMIDEFLQGMGFSPSPMDPCLYKRKDALIILFVDDLRVAAIPSVLKEIHAALFEKFQITTSDGTRFLGMDTLYDIKRGYMKLHMETYIVSIHERFHGFDVTKGVPFREIVGCLLWVCLNVMGPELLRVKDLARRSNDYTKDDFNVAIKVLDRIYSRRMNGIVIVRGGAGSELVPSSTRAPQEDTGFAIDPIAETYSPLVDDIGALTGLNELREKALFKVKEEISDIDLKPVILPLNDRYSLILYADASFAVGPTMQSVSGLVIYLNGTPLLWASLKQTIVVDSSCSAEFVAASVACKQAIHAENLIGFLGFTCPKPYVMYTDSTACLAIASNSLRLGNVRHLAIRYHLVRCYVTIGEIVMRYCVTEEMVADLLTKIVVGAQDTRLTVRFYTLCPYGSSFVSAHQ
jgi:hypothetical protein